MIINPQFGPGLLPAYQFTEGLAAVLIGDDKTGKWGYIDNQGKIVINAQFDFAKEGLAAVRMGDDKTGTWGSIGR